MFRESYIAAPPTVVVVATTPALPLLIVVQAERNEAEHERSGSGKSEHNNPWLAVELVSLGGAPVPWNMSFVPYLDRPTSASLRYTSPSAELAGTPAQKYRHVSLSCLPADACADQRGGAQSFNKGLEIASGGPGATRGRA